MITTVIMALCVYHVLGTGWALAFILGVVVDGFISALIKASQ